MPLLHLHGPPAITRDDGARVPLAPREAALLAWLHLEGPTPRARLAGWLWPAGDDAKARANLRQTLLRLRRGAGEVLAEHDGVLQLAPSLRADDVAPAPGLQRLLGPLEFDDVPELAQWLHTRREAAARAQRRAALDQAQAHLDAGRTREAQDLAEALLADDSASEEAHRLRMQALLGRGDRAAAVAAWDDCRLALRAAFGIAPSEATNELGRRILAAEAVPPPARQGTLPAALSQPPRRAGHAAVWQALQQALQARQPVLLRGTAGSGKSRLLADALRGRAALCVSARPGDTVLPGALVARLVSALDTAWQPALEGSTRRALALLLPRPGEPGARSAAAADQQQAQRAMLRLLQAAQQRGLEVLAIDDLQYADTLSLEVLTLLLGGAHGDPVDAGPTVQPVLTCRVAALRPEVQTLLDLVAARPGARVLTLPALDAAGVAALLEGLPLAEAGVAPQHLGPLAQTLWRQVGGNPAELLEALRALWGGALRGWQPGQPLRAPASLHDSVRQRLATLTPDALQLAQLAAVAQGDFSLALAAAALGRAPLALAPLFAELEAAQVLQGTRFGHDLLAEAVAQSLPAALRPALHRLVAELLQAQQGPAARIAAHLDEAGAPLEAAAWHLQSGHDAAARWRLAEAQAGFEAAWRAYAGSAAAEHREPAFRAGVEAARCALWQSQYAQAQALIGQLVPRQRTGADRVRLGTLQVLMAVNTRQIDEAVARARTLAAELALAAPLAPAELLQTLRPLTVALPMGNEDALALHTLDAVAARLDLHDPAQALDMHVARGGLLLRVDRERDAVAPLRAAFAAAGTLHRVGLRVAVGGDLLRALQTLGRVDEALGVGEVALAAALDGGFGAGYAFDLHGQLAMLQLVRGQPAAAQAHHEAAKAAFERSGRRSDDVMLRAMVATLRGDLPAAQALLQAAGPHDGSLLTRWLLRVRVRATEAAGRDARPLHRALLALGSPTLADRLAAARAEGTPTRDEAQALLDQARAAGWRPRERLALLLLARACLAEGDRAAAVVHAEASWAMTDAIDPWLEDTARRWCDAAALLREAGASAAAAAAEHAGRGWLLAGAQALPEGSAARQAWLHGSVWHRHLAGT